MKKLWIACVIALPIALWAVVFWPAAEHYEGVREESGLLAIAVIGTLGALYLLKDEIK